MRKTLLAAVALLATAAICVAVAAGGTGSGNQRIRIDVKGTDPYSFELKPTSSGAVKADAGSVTFCCWSESQVVRAGAKLLVTNPRMTLSSGDRGQRQLKIRQRIEWTPLADGWTVFTGTWKVVGGTYRYAGLAGHGRVVGTWAPETDPDRALRLRLTGFLEEK